MAASILHPSLAQNLVLGPHMASTPPEATVVRARAGFTIIELVVVILIGSILVGIALSSFQTAQAAIAARSAKNMYATLHQRARVRSIELGQRALLYVDTTGDSAAIFSNGAWRDITHFRRQLNVDLRATPATFFICMNPRGYADPGCGFGITSPVKLEFWLSGDSTSITILPMGQLVGL
jgi:prepilin-type N-terminal cleavage/methylation domain-containing protein